MTLVKWSMSARADSTLYVARERISGFVPLLSDRLYGMAQDAGR